MDEKEKRKRGRPKIDADFTEQLVTSRRAQLNAKYMFDGMVLVKNSPEITEPDMLWKEDAASSSATSKNGILEQLGRMVEQDHLHTDDCVFFANKAIDALKSGYTSREVERHYAPYGWQSRRPMGHRKTAMSDTRSPWQLTI